MKVVTSGTEPFAQQAVDRARFGILALVSVVFLVTSGAAWGGEEFDRSETLTME